jgi:hypothetical protein
VIETLLRDLRQPEYIHVLLNPLPVYGLAVSLIGLIIAVISRSRRAQIATLTIVFLSALSAWPVFEYGERAYDPVLSMSDEPGQAWLDAHRARADKFIIFFYALAALSAVALLAPLQWPKSSGALAVSVILLGAVVLGMGGYIGYAGGKVRHREFRNGPAPPKKNTTVPEAPAS